MISLGETARELRERCGYSQVKAASRLGITQVHLSNIENDKVRPSHDLLTEYRAVFGVDLYVYAFCTRGESNRLPKDLREASARLADIWRRELDKRLGPMG